MNVYDLEESVPDLGTTYGVIGYYADTTEKHMLLKFAQAFRAQFLQDHPDGRFEIIEKTRAELHRCSAIDPLGHSSPGVLKDWIQGSVGIKWTVMEHEGKVPTSGTHACGIWAAQTAKHESGIITQCPECGCSLVVNPPSNPDGSVPLVLTTRPDCPLCGWDRRKTGTSHMSSTHDQSIKADAGKPCPVRVPPSLVYAVAKILDYGARKYGEGETWRKVEPWRYKNALYRHWLEYQKNPASVDEESGMPHLWHLACNAAFLIELEGAGQ